VLTAGAIVAVTWGAPNQIGSATFLILLVSRLSAKMNLFLGVPNFTDEFFPDHLRYLTSYLRKSEMSGLFPISAGAGVTLAGAEAWMAFGPGAGPFAVVGSSLLFALTTLALIEHAFMVLALPDAALWRWMLPAPAKNENG
jgi:putative photosynthetic complex assembly protein 2